MSEEFRMIVAKGIGNRWSVLSVGGEDDDREYCSAWYCSAWDEIEAILDDCDLEEAIGEGSDLLPADLGVYLFGCELYIKHIQILFIRLLSVKPLWSKDKDLFVNGFCSLSLSPERTPISSKEQIIERIKNVDAKVVAESILKDIRVDAKVVAESILKDIRIDEMKELPEDLAKTLLSYVPSERQLKVFHSTKDESSTKGSSNEDETK